MGLLLAVTLYYQLKKKGLGFILNTNVNILISEI